MVFTTHHSSLITAVLILGHGSPIPEANGTLFEVARTIRAKGGYTIVQPAFLQFERPDFLEAVDILVKQGIRRIVVHPYFLYKGAHVTKDLPSQIDTTRRKYPNLEIVLTPHLGYHEKLVEVAIERIEEVIKENSEFRIPNSELKTQKSKIANRKSQIVSQHPIEVESFRIIGEGLDESRFSALELPIVKRIIHATADFEYAELVRFGNNAIEVGIEAISKGANVITDVRMVEVGVNRRIPERFGGKVRCFVSDEDVIHQAQKDNMTRTAAAMRKALEFISGNIVAVGNAPTALVELIEIIKGGWARPVLVIGVPVGFVGAEESKEGLMRLDVPYISIKGKKGGSTVAVAIVNALLMLAEEKQLGIKN
ncbi:MAG: precorrin-8X methylmutase [Deltaproteobacteria bacterium]|nr:precorrin-8X methylmutase [Deltaproteobacteria bacterium]